MNPPSYILQSEVKEGSKILLKRKEKSMCTIIAISNQKDGVSKTTATYNLGTSLALNLSELSPTYARYTRYSSGEVDTPVRIRVA